MSIVPTNVAQAMAGLSQAERSQVQDKRSEADRLAEKRTRQSHNDEAIVNVEAIEAARRLAGNDQEEAHEDRQSHAQYAPGGGVNADGSRRIDIEG